MCNSLTALDIIIVGQHYRCMAALKSNPTLILKCCRKGGVPLIHVRRVQHDWSGQRKREESAAGARSRQVGFARSNSATFIT